MNRLLSFVLAISSALSAAAQETTIFQSCTFDNFYLGLSGGAALKLTNSDFSSDRNPTVALRLGRDITPVFGLAVDGAAYFSAHPFPCGYFRGTKVSFSDVSLLSTINFSNWFGRYTGRPRLVEVSGIYGMGWGHSYNNTGKHPINNLTSRAGLQLAVNLGTERQWQIALEPTVRWALNGGGYSGIEYNLNRAFMQVSLGVSYRFRNSNGTHSFALAELRDQGEIEALNSSINELRRAITERDRAIAEKDHAIAGLQSQLNSARREITDYEKRPPVVSRITQVTEVAPANLQPTVVFSIGSTVVERSQQANVALVAQYMKENPKAIIDIRGYTSPDGGEEINLKISQARANAVKDMLVQKYGIAPARLRAVGMGATSKIFDELEFNRVVTFTDVSKD